MAREHYLGGREHAAIKHYFLEQYLEVLCFKTLQSQGNSEPVFSYIDGFTGPWAARDEDFTDTSFGIAIKVLKRVKERLPHVKIKGIFCEERLKAFKTLNEFLSEHSGSIETKCVRGRFEDHISEIQSFIGTKGFRFAFLDPTGWKVDVSAITPLLKDSWSEVLFNFMAEFIGRFPDFDKVGDAYSSLLGDVDWKRRYESFPDEIPNEEKILQIFRDVLKEKWGFSHILELPIQKVGRDRIFYRLVYGTRSPYGVFAFRESQAKAEREGHAVAFEAKATQTKDMFSADEHAESLAASIGVGSRINRERLSREILRQLQSKGPTVFVKLAANVLEIVPAREKDVKNTVAELAKMKSVDFTRERGRTALSSRSLISISTAK
jgi:three-Cys-motif partner protein